MRRSAGSRRRRPRGMLLLAAVAAAAGLSLAVRWSDLSGRFAGVERPFQIEVLNGTRTAGIAMDVAKDLRGRGIDVLIVDNAERFDFRESVLIDRTGDPKLMRRIANVTGCRLVVEQLREKPIVDATYVIGADRVKRP